MKIVSIVGARPQFIKLGPLSSMIRKSLIEEIIIHTGQHYDRQMSDLMFRDLKIPIPNYNLGIGSAKHGKQTGKMLIEIEKILLLESPNLVIVFGDTNSTLAGALAAAKLGIKVIHVEAGLRSFNKSMPEELNRVVTDHLSDYLFAPTETAIKNLDKENLGRKSFLSGDIMVDALTNSISIAVENSKIDQLYKLPADFLLLTLHRPYNVDNPERLSLILKKISELDRTILFPIHPRTRKVIIDYKIVVSPSIIMTEPLSYFDFLKAEFLSSKIITDSGGIQKEAFLLKKPCITIRPETEWVETVEAGWNILIDPEFIDFCEKIIRFNPNPGQPKVFGENVALKMIELIKSFN